MNNIVVERNKKGISIWRNINLSIIENEKQIDKINLLL